MEAERLIALAFTGSLLMVVLFFTKVLPWLMTRGGKQK